MELISTEKINIETQRVNIPNLEPLFIGFCEAIADIANAHNIPTEAYNERGLAQLNSLVLERKIQTTNTLKSYLEQLTEASANKISLVGDNRKHAWWSLKSLGLIPPSDLFDKIDATDFIEIYDDQSIQVFRSFELFRHLSYSLSEIFTYTWVDLFERDEFVFRRMYEMVNGILEGKMTGIITPAFPSHIVQEKFSKSKRWVEMKHGIICPLYNGQGAVRGLLTTFKAINYGSLNASN